MPKGKKCNVKRHYTIDQIIEKIQEKEMAGMDVIKTPLLILANPDVDFQNARVLDWDVPKFDILLTQDGKTIAMKNMGNREGTNRVFFLLVWIQEYDPDKDGPPCHGKMIYFFDQDYNIDPVVIQLD